MTTLITQENKQRMRVPHHPARLHNPQTEAAWRAKRRTARLLRAMLVVSWISFVGLLVALYVRRAS